jgi:hypothetical protein
MHQAGQMYLERQSAGSLSTCTDLLLPVPDLPIDSTGLWPRRKVEGVYSRLEYVLVRIKYQEFNTQKVVEQTPVSINVSVHTNTYTFCEYSQVMLKETGVCEFLEDISITHPCLVNNLLDKTQGWQIKK